MSGWKDGWRRNGRIRRGGEDEREGKILEKRKRKEG